MKLYRNNTVLTCCILIATAAAIMNLEGCASFQASIHKNDITNCTTVVDPNGNIDWSGYFKNIPYSDYDSMAQRQAAADASAGATYQKVVEYVQRPWPFIGWDYQFDRTELAEGLRNGIYQLGKRINNLIWIPATSHYDAVTNNYTMKPGEWKLMDPSKPGEYYPVYGKVIRKSTVNAIDNEKYNQLYGQYYKEYYDENYKLYLKYKQARENLQASYKDMWQTEEYKGDEYIDISDDLIFKFNFGDISGKAIKLILDKRLNELTDATLLIVDGDSFTIVAYKDNGINKYVCKNKN